MPLEYAKDGRIATFTLNRPEALNAIDPDVVDQFSKALANFRDDDEVWVGIVTGAGEKAFCAGADIKRTLPWLKDNANAPWRVPPTTMRGFELWKPLIAAVNGLALGGGLELALSCDLRIAAENASFGVPEVKLGLIPGWGGSARLAHVLPWAIAAEMLFTGNPISAQEAYRLGLVNRVVPLSELMATARGYADAICQAGPLAVRGAKRVMLTSKHQGLEEGLRLESQVMDYLFTTADSEEGTRAFVEKRKAVFHGR
jgi:enoyl-CoA hydratase/carnithine racemase